DTVKMYDVDCEPLGQRCTWLVLDTAPESPRPTSIWVFLPRPLAERASRSGWGSSCIPVAAERAAHGPVRPDRIVFRVDPIAGRNQVESVVLGAYRSIIDWT